MGDKKAEEKPVSGIYYGEKYGLPENLADSSGGSIVSALFQGLKEHDPDRSKVLALFEKYSTKTEGK